MDIKFYLLTYWLFGFLHYQIVINLLIFTKPAAKVLLFSDICKIYGQEMLFFTKNGLFM